MRSTFLKKYSAVQGFANFSQRNINYRRRHGQNLKHFAHSRSMNDDDSFAEEHEQNQRTEGMIKRITAWNASILRSEHTCGVFAK